MECFVGDTQVLVEPWGQSLGRPSQSLDIERLEVGDLVLSRCEITGETAYKPVTKVFAHGFAKVFSIVCDYGHEYYVKHGLDARPYILTTADHPFWVVDKGWTKVRDLAPGDELSTYNGIKATFRSMGINSYTSEVFNIEVADFHTYFVDASGIWVHGK
jgi:hypothetical protein